MRTFNSMTPLMSLVKKALCSKVRLAHSCPQDFGEILQMLESQDCWKSFQKSSYLLGLLEKLLKQCIFIRVVRKAFGRVHIYQDCQKFFWKSSYLSGLQAQRSSRREIELFNPFHATDIFLYPLKTSENLWFSDVFRGVRKSPVA